MDEFEFLFACARAGVVQHGAREVEADGARAAGVGEARQVTRAAGEVEHGVARADARQGERAAAPALVEPARQQAVQKVVTRRDAVEHRAHQRALLRGRVRAHQHKTRGVVVTVTATVAMTATAATGVTAAMPMTVVVAASLSI